MSLNHLLIHGHHALRRTRNQQVCITHHLWGTVKHTARTLLSNSFSFIIRFWVLGIVPKKKFNANDLTWEIEQSQGAKTHT